MTRRKPITERMKIDALLWIGAIYCSVCRERVLPSHAIHWDHVNPLALGGLHHFVNLQPLHTLCHAAKTRGTGATTAGSDIGKISKVKRIQREQKFVVVKSLGAEDMDDHSAFMARAKRKFAQGRKLQSRGFRRKGT